jgi:hypothetical protein
VKDADSDIHATPEELGQFLEKHYRHELIFTHEDDYDMYEGEVYDQGKHEEPVEWPRFKIPDEGLFWGAGKLFKFSAPVALHDID